MIDGRRILAVVPARGGSKGIALKNLRTVAGVPMVARVGAVVARVPMIDRAVVSTDHDEIARIAEAAGLAAPFRRPEPISGDRIADWRVLEHALGECERLDGVTYDIIVMLQPTSPLRRPEHVVATIEKLVNEGWDAVWTVSRSDSKAHPLKQLVVDESGLSLYDHRGAEIIARQQLDPVYHRNGIAYVMTRECLTKGRAIEGPRTGALVLDGPFVSIDTEWDIELVEFILTRQAATERGSR